MNNLEQLIFNMTKPICDRHGLELVEVNFYKRYTDYILEVLIDKEEGVSTDDTTIVSEELNVLLDEADPIDKAYILEVSSLGCERELKSDEDVQKAIGKYVHIKTYEKIQIDNDLVKEIEGTLEAIDNDTYIISTKNKTRNIKLSINKKIIALIRLAIKF